ncbi:hypothetical protein FHR47_002308 [Xanthomonas arboricola]|uniref:hypothetical protein n=1 Tax=Xanthomonas cannabis TaxID=1885674 RepID=UPI001607B5FA|nr:hypothetical protein [Xanthomonas cannabis]MBB3802060.1 hypothetical protein [Xanthomonas cannabis]
MADPIPALPPGFVLDAAPAAPAPRQPAMAAPALPPGFVLEDDIPTLPVVQATRPDFSNVQAGVDSTARTSAGDGWEPGVVRDVALGGRALLQGAGSLFGALGGDAINTALINPIARALGAQEAQPYREELGGLADVLGLPKAQNAGERVNADIAEALTGTGLTMGAGGLLNAGRSAVSAVAPSLRAKLAEVLSAQPVLQTVSAATGAGASGAVRESGGGSGAQLAAALAGGLAPGVAATAVPATLRGALRGGEANRQALQTAIQEFGSVGATPSVGQGTGAWSRQGVETLLGAGPTSAGVMARAAERQGEQIGAGLSDVADTLFRNPSAERAGRAIESGIRGEGGFLNTSRERANQLYGRLDELLPTDSRVGVDNVREALASLNSEIPGAPSVSRFFQNARLQGIEGALQQDAGGIEGVLSRPGMRERVAQMRQDLTEQAATRRAELAQETNQQRQDLVAAAGQQREQLMAEAQLVRDRLANTIEARRADLYRQADEQRQALYAEQQAALRENERLRSLNLSDLKPVLSDAEIDARVPTYAQIDQRLPTAADIEAQVPAPRDIEAQVPQAGAIEGQLTPDSSITDPNFGQDHIERQINEFLQGQVDGKLPYQALQKLRTLVGGELEGSSLLSDVPRSKWKAVYGALTRDMEAAATTPEAKQALSRANTYFNARAERIDAIDRVIDRNGGPEKIYSAVMGGVRDGGSTLRAVMQSLPEEGQKAITAAAIRRMGMANPGAQDAAGEAFSATTFLTNWNKVSPEARRALFNRYGPGFSKDIDKIARVAERIKEGGAALSNPSGTARQGAAITYWGSLAGAIMTGNAAGATGIAGAGISANLLARLMTNPTWVKWLAKSTDLPVGALPAQVNVLKRIAAENDEPDIAAAADELSNRAQNSQPNQQQGGNK